MNYSLPKNNKLNSNYFSSQRRILFSFFLIPFFCFCFFYRVLNNQADKGSCVPASAADKICARTHTHTCTCLKYSSSFWRAHGFTRRSHVRGFFTPLFPLLKGRRLKGETAVSATVFASTDPNRLLTSPLWWNLKPKTTGNQALQLPALLQF